MESLINKYRDAAYKYMAANIRTNQNGESKLKKLLIISAMALVFGSNTAYSSMEELSVSVGAVSWYNKYVPISRIAGMDVPQSSYAFMYGPTIKAQYKKFSCAATYLISSDNYNLVVTDSPVKVRHARANSSASRSDVDFVLGYKLTPALSLTTGYKGIFVDDDITLVSRGVSTDGVRHETYNVGTFGAGLNIPVGKKLVCYVNGSALIGSFHNDVSYPSSYRRLNEADYDAIAWGAAADASAVYSIFNSLSANIGLKFQYIKAGSDNSSFFGPNFGLDYRF